MGWCELLREWKRIYSLLTVSSFVPTWHTWFWVCRHLLWDMSLLNMFVGETLLTCKPIQKTLISILELVLPLCKLCIDIVKEICCFPTCQRIVMLSREERLLINYCLTVKFWVNKLSNWKKMRWVTVKISLNEVLVLFHLLFR